MVKKRTIYTASDGKEFDNEKEAEEHDKKVIRESIKAVQEVRQPDFLCHGYFWFKCNHADIYLPRSS